MQQVRNLSLLFGQRCQKMFGNLSSIVLAIKTILHLRTIVFHDRQTLISKANHTVFTSSYDIYSVRLLQLLQFTGWQCLFQFQLLLGFASSLGRNKSLRNYVFFVVIPGLQHSSTLASASPKHLQIYEFGMPILYRRSLRQ